MNAETISIRNGCGTEKYRAAIVFRAGPFVVHNEDGYKRLWEVTHEPSGFACCRCIRNKANAATFATWLKERFEAYGIDTGLSDQKAFQEHPRWDELKAEVVERRSTITDYYGVQSASV